MHDRRPRPQPRSRGAGLQDGQCRQWNGTQRMGTPRLGLPNSTGRGCARGSIRETILGDGADHARRVDSDRMGAHREGPRHGRLVCQQSIRIRPPLSQLVWRQQGAEIPRWSPCCRFSACPRPCPRAATGRVCLPRGRPATRPSGRRPRRSGRSVPSSVGQPDHPGRRAPDGRWSGHSGRSNRTARGPRRARALRTSPSRPPW